MDKKKLLRAVWATVIEKGQITTGSWSYYGNMWEVPQPPDSYKGYSWDWHIKESDRIRGLIKTIGIDWDKMVLPKSESLSGFNGTFAENERYEETSIGEIILLNGDRYTFGTCGGMPFSKAAIELYEILSNKDKISEIVGS
jgi:hypothetical protein